MIPTHLALPEYRASRANYPAMVTHCFTISTGQPHWSRRYDVAECGSYRAVSLKSCAARKLARVMIDAGEPDGPIEAWHNGRLSYRVPSLYAFGKFTLSENPTPRLKRWFPNDRFAISAGLEASEGEVAAQGGKEARE